MISLIVTLVVIAFLVWLLNTCVPMAEPYRRGINGLIGLLVVLYVLSWFGIIHLPYGARR